LIYTHAWHEMDTRICTERPEEDHFDYGSCIITDVSDGVQELERCMERSMHCLYSMCCSIGPNKRDDSVMLTWVQMLLPCQSHTVLYKAVQDGEGIVILKPFENLTRP
jgi:hypothetical protein